MFLTWSQNHVYMVSRDKDHLTTLNIGIVSVCVLMTPVRLSRSRLTLQGRRRWFSRSGERRTTFVPKYAIGRITFVFDSAASIVLTNTKFCLSSKHFKMLMVMQNSKWNKHLTEKHTLNMEKTNRANGK